MVPMLDIKFVISAHATQKTILTNNPLGCPPRIFKTVCPISSPTPVLESAVETTLIPATIHTISQVRVFITSGISRTLNTIRTRRPAAGITLVISLPSCLVNIKPSMIAANTPKIKYSSFLEIGAASLTSFTWDLSIVPFGISL